MTFSLFLILLSLELVKIVNGGLISIPVISLSWQSSIANIFSPCGTA